jgi:hypothetical protein
MHFLNFCEFDTFVGIIDDLGVSIVFFLNGDARLGSGLCENMKFSEPKVKACVYNPQKKVCVQIIMLNLGSLLDVDVKTVACFKRRLFVSLVLSSGIYMTYKAQ